MLKIDCTVSPHWEGRLEFGHTPRWIELCRIHSTEYRRYARHREARIRLRKGIRTNPPCCCKRTRNRHCRASTHRYLKRQETGQEGITVCKAHLITSACSTVFVQDVSWQAGTVEIAVYDIVALLLAFCVSVTTVINYKQIR